MPFVNCCQFMYLVISLLFFLGRMWALIVSFPDHCLAFYIPSLPATIFLASFATVLVSLLSSSFYVPTVSIKRYSPQTTVLPVQGQIIHSIKKVIVLCF